MLRRYAAGSTWGSGALGSGTLGMLALGEASVLLARFMVNLLAVVWNTEALPVVVVLWLW